MEPISLIGLVGNTVQFLDFTSGIISTSVESYSSATNTVAQYADIDATAAALENLIAPIQSSALTTDSDIDKICESCLDCARELQEILRKVKLKGKSKRESLRKAILVVWKEDKINALDERLTSLRQQLTIHLISDIKKDVNAVTIQQDVSFRQLDLDAQIRAQALVQALNDSQDVFRALLRAQTSSVESLKNDLQSLGELQDQNTIDIIAEVGDNQLGINQQIQNATVDIKGANEDTRQIMMTMVEEALHEIKEDIRKKNDELQTTIAQFIEAQNLQNKAKLQERSNALTSAIIALQTMYDNIKLLLPSVRDQAQTWLVDATAQAIFLKRLTADSSRNAKKRESFEPADGYMLNLSLAYYYHRCGTNFSFKNLEAWFYTWEEDLQGNAAKLRAESRDAPRLISFLELFQNSNSPSKSVTSLAVSLKRLGLKLLFLTALMDTLGLQHEHKIDIFRRLCCSSSYYPTRNPLDSDVAIWTQISLTCNLRDTIVEQEGLQRSGVPILHVNRGIASPEIVSELAALIETLDLSLTPRMSLFRTPEIQALAECVTKSVFFSTYEQYPWKTVCDNSGSYTLLHNYCRGKGHRPYDLRNAQASYSLDGIVIVRTSNLNNLKYSFNDMCDLDRTTSVNRHLPGADDWIDEDLLHLECTVQVALGTLTNISELIRDPTPPTPSNLYGADTI